eukprot:CAMPEP_0114626520 /NCGR_PEP_ID=MMETSP0168-20121206/11824_1 /TAXON_ID=95228 ORGANISM="Vannella sp., Strain DIVA3 517/6/12" /NCGR_SAMPLE_ID=MMETSP0168 /ASSEMBLY_ACC=CAM_ASM_000044 /LENGTH=481 /DNA_ID=CAMNT_0001837827 /DNA_START=50 /DNA_END=1492 /DNA_ORIENTATION=-
MSAEGASSVEVSAAELPRPEDSPGDNPDAQQQPSSASLGTLAEDPEMDPEVRRSLLRAHKKLSKLVLKELRYETAANGSITMLSGSMENLTRYVITQADSDYASTEAFVLTYRQFGYQPKDMFGIVEKFYGLVTTKKIGQALDGIGVFLALWVLVGYKSDFRARGTRGYLYHRLLKFLERLETDGFKDAANRVKLAIIRASATNRRDQTVKVTIAAGSSVDTEEAEERLDKHRNLLDISASALAEHLTLRESKIYRAIQPPELLNMAWKSHQKYAVARNVVTLVERTNKVSYWVATEVCMCKDLKKRVAAMKRFINVANKCVQMHNYNTTMEILGGLNNVAVQRLKKAWGALPEKYDLIWENLTALMDTKNNYQEYRNAVAAAKAQNTGVVPFLGVFLRDLTFIEDGNPNTVEDGQINFEKTKLLGSVIRDVQQYQQYAYSIRKVPSIVRYLRKAMVLPEDPDDTIYDLSLQVEPRAAENQ